MDCPNVYKGTVQIAQYGHRSVIAEDGGCILGKVTFIRECIITMALNVSIETDSAEFTLEQPFRQLGY